MSSSPNRAGEAPGPKKALFIDADPDVRAMLVYILDPLVWSVRRAADNKAALDLARTAHFDFILTSEKTAGKEDVDLPRRIRGIRPHARFIILIEKRTPTDFIASMREHAFSYFSRPFSLSALADMARAASEGPCWDDGIEVLSATPDWIRVAANCDLKTADRLAQFMYEIADLPEPEADAVAMAFRELLMNAIEHGGHFRADQYVEISYVRAKHMVMCRVNDPDEAFPLDEIDHAAVANPEGDPARHIAYREAKGLRAGGYGVLIANSISRKPEPAARGFPSGIKQPLMIKLHAGNPAARISFHRAAQSKAYGDCIAFWRSDNYVSEGIFFSLWLTLPVLVNLAAIVALLEQIVGRKEGWSRFDGFYWSFITATTVGYGDIRPVRRISRMLSILTALVGLTFTGILVAVAVDSATIALTAHEAAVSNP